MSIVRRFKQVLSVTILCASSAVIAADVSHTKAPTATAEERAAAFRDIPLLDNAFINAAPIDQHDGIVVGQLGIDSGDKQRIIALAHDIATNNKDKYDSLLIAHKNKLLFESYFLRGRSDLPHFQASATKVYTSLALGRAIQLGYLSMTDLDKPLVSFLKHLDPTTFAEGVENITLHHALTMQSGLRITEAQMEHIHKEPSQLKGQGLVQAQFEHTAPVTSASQTFKYSSDPDLIMQVIEAVVPGSAYDFIKKELLDKLGISDFHWRINQVSGIAEAGWRTRMRSRDMLKWGLLALNKGKWRTEQLIPPDFVNRAITRHLLTGDEDVFGGGKDVSNAGYGYYWWGADLRLGEQNFYVASAQGGGGQYIALIEELELLIVVTAHKGDNSTLQTIAEKILPAFIKKTPATGNGHKVRNTNKSALQGPYVGQTPPGLIPRLFEPGVRTQQQRDWGGGFTPDMQEYYFSRWYAEGDSKKFVYTLNNNQWHLSEVDAASSPSISPDGQTMYASKVFRKRTTNGWSQPESIGSMFDDFRIMRLTVSAAGTYVFDEATRDGKGLLRYSTVVNGERQPPQAFGKQINTGKWTAHPFIAPDESYLIWDSEREGGYGDSDMYISFRQADGSWGEAINFGDEINTEGEDGGGYVTPDGKYLFYCRRCSPPDFDIMWVDARVIENLRPKH